MKKTDFKFIGLQRDLAEYVYSANTTKAGACMAKIITTWNKRGGDTFVCPFCNKVVHKSKSSEIDVCGVHGEFRNTKTKADFSDLVILVARETDSQNYIGPMIYNVNTDVSLIAKDLDYIRKASEGKIFTIRFLTLYKKYNVYPEHMTGSSHIIAGAILDTLSKAKEFKLANPDTPLPDPNYGRKNKDRDKVYKEKRTYVKNSKYKEGSNVARRKN